MPPASTYSRKRCIVGNRLAAARTAIRLFSLLNIGSDSTRTRLTRSRTKTWKAPSRSLEELASTDTKVRESAAAPVSAPCRSTAPLIARIDQQAELSRAWYHFDRE